MAYSAGELDQRVTFTRVVLTPDGAGGHTSVYTPFSTVWALVKPLSARERSAFGGIEASGIYRCVIRNRQDLREDDTLVWLGQSWNIRAILQAGTRPAFLELQIQRGVAT